MVGIRQNLSGRAFRAVRVADFILWEGMLAGTTFVQLAVAARQALVVGGVGLIFRHGIRRDFAGALLIGFGTVLVTCFAVMAIGIGDACKGKQCCCEHKVFHG